MEYYIASFEQNTTTCTLTSNQTNVRDTADTFFVATSTTRRLTLTVVAVASSLHTTDLTLVSINHGLSSGNTNDDYRTGLSTTFKTNSLILAGTASTISNVRVDTSNDTIPTTWVQATSKPIRWSTTGSVPRVDILVCYLRTGLSDACFYAHNNIANTGSVANVRVGTNVPLNSQAYIKVRKAGTDSISAKSAQFQVVPVGYIINSELTVTENYDDVNDAHVVFVDDSTDTNDVDLLSFKIKAEGSDLTLGQIALDLTSIGAGVTEIANDFRLMMSGDEVGRITIDNSNSFAASTDTTRRVTITELAQDGVVVDEGDTVAFTLVADINDIEGAFTNGDSISVKLTASSGISAKDENNVAVTNLIGSADSSGTAFMYSGIIAETVSTDQYVDEGNENTNTDDLGVFKIIFDVTAIEDDAYIELGSATRGIVESNTGANFVIKNGSNTVTTGAVALSDLSRVSGGTLTGNFIKINADSTARLELSVIFNPASFDQYRLYLYSINSAAIAVDATAQQVLTPEVNYRTGFVSVAQGSSQDANQLASVIASLQGLIDKLKEAFQAR